ncbi:MAG: alpha-glucan family phosphorylase [Bacteroidota bacterium]
MIKPDYIFETSWEVCNKVGGIYTVVSTKALTLVQDYKDNLILIGPDVWKDSHDNAEFIEDKFLFKSWRKQAEKEGLRIRVGRWNITGKPVAILVDFTPYFAIKDKVFAELWEFFKLDSLTGGWDYIEPAMFGYASAKVIESFYNYNLTAQDKIIAQFHEWMTGSGILYLRTNVPQIGCVFTTHATILGRSLAGNGQPLYKNIDKYNPDTYARNFSILSKHSLERLSAHNADSFTTVSDITAKECKYFLEKEVDLVTQNGFEDGFVPNTDEFLRKRKNARRAIIEVAQAVFNQPVDENVMLVINSGRYEFKNKGIDLYIESLAKLNNDPNLNKEVIAVLAVPAYHGGARPDVCERIDKPNFDEPHTQDYLTHFLHEMDSDPALRKLKEVGLHNKPEDKVKVMFVPCYLNGHDGIFNMPYYDFLIGFDISVFPSYYEPWGYTPLESIAFHIPTVTTSLAGFGVWVNDKYGPDTDGVRVIERDDENDDFVIAEISTVLTKYALMSVAEMDIARDKAFEISRIALWENLVNKYLDAYSIALEKVSERFDLYNWKHTEVEIDSLIKEKQHPIWKKIFIKPSIPESLQDLHRLSKNLWWSWNHEAQELFEYVNSEQFERCKRNPISMLNTTSYNRFQELEADADFIDKLKTVMRKFDDYMDKAQYKSEHQVAYFSMEYGLHNSLKIFSGGLGMLAGDYLKEASDSNVNIVGVGLLYRYGYFIQKLSPSGEQIAEYKPQKYTDLPLSPVRDDEGEWLKISISLPGRKMFAKIWRVDVGRIPLYLLDTDLEENTDSDRQVTHQLYGGDWENRFKQELLIGVGGIRFLDKLGLKPDVYHCNEGHAAFIGLERLRMLVHRRKLTFNQAVEVVRSSTLFTTHTPVPAGHDEFTEDILRAYIPHYADRLNISWNAFMSLGRFDENNLESKFSMSVLALKLSQEVNGVSKIHGRVSREMFAPMYEGYFADEIHISSVTNGVHYPTWTATRWKNLYNKEFGENFVENQSNLSLWDKIQYVNDSDIWNIRNEQRTDLVNYLKYRVSKDMTRRQENPQLILKTIENFDENAFTIGFARRFATYKRAHLLFNNLDRLSQILNNKERPTQLVYAGKAHPADKAGQDLIKRIVEISKMPQFIGKVAFIEDYDMELGKMLTSGVDMWLNTPTRPLEASGTSGEKAIMNGVVNFSVLDGWWAEGYLPEAGWALKEERTYECQDFQNELDSETLYNSFEYEIIPMFYDRNENEVPVKWVSVVKNTISKIAPRFTMKRMIDDYQAQFYTKLFERSDKIRNNNFEMAKQLSAWKKKMLRGWDSIELLELSCPNSTEKPMALGDNFYAELTLDTHELDAEDIGIEIIFGQKTNDEVKEIESKYELKIAKIEGSVVKFICDIPSTKAGVFDYAFRMYPKHTDLPHRQDFYLIKWF